MILAVISLAQGRWIQGVIGLLIAGVAAVSITRITPWRYPNTRYRALMLPIYLLFAVALVWGLASMQSPRPLEAMGFTSWWSLAILLPAFLPLWTAGNRRWDDGQDEATTRTEER